MISLIKLINDNINKIKKIIDKINLVLKSKTLQIGMESV